MGRTDVFLGGKGTECSVKKLKMTEIKAVGQPLEQMTMYHYLNKKQSLIAKKLETILRQMKESGEIEAIQEQSIQDFINQCK